MKASLVFKRIGFYFLSFTWGFIMSFIGLLVIGFSACFKKVNTFHGRLYAVWGEGWGGLELGCFFICGLDCQQEQLMAHECGHGIQNIIWGPLGIFVIFIPSAIRYWYREIIWRKDKQKFWKLPDYDAIWFEGQATRWGMKYVVTDRI